MTTLRREIEIRSRPESVWPILTDFEAMPDWFLGVKRVSLLSGAVGPGAERLLTLIYGRSHHERIERWETNKLFSLVVLDPPFFAREWRASIRLETIPGAVLLQWEMRWEPRYRMPGRALSRFVVAPVVDLALRISLGRLKKIAERAA